MTTHFCSISPNGKESTTNINGVRPCSTIDLTKNAWDSFISSIQTKCKNCIYNLRPQHKF